MTAPTPEEQPDMSAQAQPQPDEPNETESGESPGQLVPVDPAFKARIFQLGKKFPDKYGDANLPIPADDLNVRRADTYRGAWEASLLASGVTGLGGWRLAGLDPEQQPGNLLKWVNSVAAGEPLARNLILAGSVGAGKTVAAIAAGWAMLEEGMSVRFVEHSKYLMWLRPDSMPTSGPYKDISRDQLRKRMRDSQVLIIDDLAASLDPTAPVSPHAKDETMTLIGDRIDTEDRYTIVTTNHTSEALERMFGAQFMSRLAKDGYAFRFTGEDRRGRLTW